MRRAQTCPEVQPPPVDDDARQRAPSVVTAGGTVFWTLPLQVLGVSATFDTRTFAFAPMPKPKSPKGKFDWHAPSPVLVEEVPNDEQSLPMMFGP